MRQEKGGVMRIPLLCFVLLVSLTLSRSSSVAQEITVGGTVTSEPTGDVLPGANISVRGTKLGVTTDINGNFRLQLPGMTQATLVVTYVGYKTMELPVSSSTETLKIALEEDVLRLSEIVVTGIATSVKRRNLANAVGTISARELVPVPAQTIERALTAKFAGISVSQNTGAPGGGLNVDFRGLSTIEGATQPLYIVDGVIVNNSAIQSGIDLVTSAPSVGNPTPQGQPANRIADVNPNDIETVEVLKGPSAAALYGSKATNGVVIITTKQGAPGRTRIDVSQQVGFNTILKKMGTRRYASAAEAEAAYGLQGRQLYDQGGGQNIDYEDVIYGEEGFINETDVSVSGGSERTQFYASGIFRDEDGIIKRTGYKKYGTRLNVAHRVSDRLKVNAGLNFLRTESDRSITGNENRGGTTLGVTLAFTPSFLDLRPKNGVYPVNPFVRSSAVQTVDLLENNEVVYRTIASGRLHWNVLKSRQQSLDLIMTGGVDFFSQENEVFSPPELHFEETSDQPGTSIIGESESVNANLYTTLAHGYVTPGNTSFTTSAGLQVETQDMNYVLSQARGLIVTQKNIDQAASVNAFQELTKQRELGFFVQEEVNFNDRIFLTAGFRGDASSANGDPDKYFFFPKASGSIRLSQYDFWEDMRSFSPEFKLRAAYGETGNLPLPDAKFSALVPQNIGGFAGLLPAPRRGTKDIEPERTKELELGFDASILSDRTLLEFTYFRQSVSDLIVKASLPPSSGFIEEFINGGEMVTKGVEASLSASPVRSRNFRWSTRVNFYTTDSEITQLDVGPFNIQGFGTALGRYRIQEGLSPTTIVGSERDAQGNHIVLGDGTPDFQMSFDNMLKLGNFELSFLWEWQQGGNVINLATLLTDLGRTTPPDIGPGTIDDRLGGLGVRTAPYVEDAMYWKLREASLTYSFDPKLVNKWFGGQISYLRVGIGGRNLVMITDYQGYDPEVSQVGNVAIGRGVDVLPFPSSRTFYFNLSFGL